MEAPARPQFRSRAKVASTGVVPPSPNPMRLGPIPLTGLGCAAIAAGLALVPSTAELAANASNHVALADTDGDLLDDILELRLGTDPNVADPDQDGRTDLEEFLLGSDPNVFESAQSLPAPASSFAFEVYQSGPDFVFEFFALTSDRVHALELHKALEFSDRVYGFSELLPFLVDNLREPTGMSGFDAQRLRLRIPSSWFDQHASIAFGAIAVVDQSQFGASVQLTHTGGYLAEIEFAETAQAMGSLPSGGHTNVGVQDLGAGNVNGGTGTGQKSGGLVPVEPGDPGANSGAADEICVQTLVPIANLGGGRVKYVVADASCDPEPGAICMPGCSFTKDDTIIGIDVVGLLGG